MRRCVSSYSGITVFRLPGKVYVGELKRKFGMWSNLRLRRSNAIFVLVIEHWTRPQKDIGGCMGVCPTSLCVFCELEEGFRLCPSQCPVGGAPGVWGIRPLLMAIRSVRTWFALPAVSQMHFWCMMDSARAALCFLVITFVDRISRHSQRSEGLLFVRLRIVSLVFGAVGFIEQRPPAGTGAF